MNLLLTCPLGLESVLKKEIELLKYEILSVEDKQIRISYCEEALIELNLWSRIANKVYLEMDYTENITTFDQLFDRVSLIDWAQYIPLGSDIIVQVTTKGSKLTSEPTLQSITKKAVIKKLVGNSVWKEMGRNTFHIEIVLLKDRLQILVDTSGESLSKRSYRTESGEAPLRENIAAGIVLLSGWKFKESLLDPFCGSGTLCIEAAMIGRNIAPGLQRSFAFEKWDWTNKELISELRKIASEKIFQKQFTINGSDIDEEVIEKAKRNAQRAGVEDTIIFEKKDIETYLSSEIRGTIVTNPPYGIRLQEGNVQELHHIINELFTKNGVSGGCITTFDLENISKLSWKKRKLYNGGEKCNFYKKVL